jgi:5S rRNA maturation endonuclease (ribonuclease M5)
MSLDIAEAKRRLPLPELLARLGLGDHAKKSCRCPWPSNHKHNDRNPSFGIFQNGDDWGWKCHAGCGSGDEITFLERHEGLSNGDAIRRFCELAGVTADGNRKQVAPFVREKRNLFPISSCPNAPPSPDPKARAVALPQPDAAFVDGVAKRLGVNPETIRKLVADNALGYDKARGAIVFACQNPDGSIAALHLRGKKPDGQRWFAWTPEGCTAGLWRVPAIKRATKGVIVTEGETDTIAALDTGVEQDGYAVVAKTGAGIFPDEAVEHFRGLNLPVFIVGDSDKAGREGASKTAAKLAEVCEVHVVALPEMPDGKKDLRDWFALGNDKAALLALLDKARLPKVDVITEPTQPARYGLPKSFCYGLGGWIADYFALFEPRTEPSYAFHLAGALACMDTLLGRRVFWQFGNTTLYAQDYYLLAGSVAAARKSTALNCAARVIRCLETESTPYRMAEGFSYEALPDEFQEWPLRLLLLDEFTSLLVQQQKDYGKGIAQTLNSMWAGVDRIRLRFRGRDKSRAIVIENPVLTILAATSLELLQVNLRAGDHGGFTSRLLPFYAEGDSKDLPEPLPIEQHEVEALAGKLRRLCEGVSGAARWTPDAAALWADWYCQEKRNAAANPSGFASRKGDHVRKLALKLQLSRDGGLEITDTALADAITIADKSAAAWRKIFGSGPMAGGFIAAKATEALDWIRRHACPEGLAYWRISKALRFDPKTAETVIRTLELWGEIHTETRATGGTPQRLVWPKAEAAGK